MTAKVGNPLFRDMPTTVFEVMSQLALKHKSINLGQGFPDDRGPPDVLQAAADALLNGYNQYPSMMGTPELRQAVANHAKRFYGLDVDWAREILVTSGATEALGACLFGLIEPGDEVVLFEPMYDSYLPIIRQAGGIPKLVTLKAPDWSFTREDLERVFSPRTKALVINDPLNPVGKVYRRDELELIGEFLQRFDAYAVCDEVYEHLVFDGHRHLPLANYPGMAGRTVTISSAAKMFNCTGWKIGWACGAADLIAGVRAAKQYLSYVGGAPFQPAVAHALNTEQAWVAALRESLQAKRDKLGSALADLGFEVHDSFGTYFLCADPRPLGYHDSTEFCAQLPQRAGVAAIPMSAFCDPGADHADAWNHLVRFAFCKRDETLDEAIRRLSVLRK